MNKAFGCIGLSSNPLGTSMLLRPQAGSRGRAPEGERGRRKGGIQTTERGRERTPTFANTSSPLHGFEVPVTNYIGVQQS